MTKLAKWAPTPHLHSRSSTQQIMNEFTAVLILVSLCATGVYSYEWGNRYGIKVALMIIGAILVAILTEYLFISFTKKELNHREKMIGVVKSYPAITAILFALCLPIGTPVFVIVVGVILSILVGKLLFGGVGYNPFNPALVGRAIVTISWGSMLTTTLEVTDSMSSATPLVNLAANHYVGTYETLVAPYGGFLGLLVGNYPSAVGESISIVIILAGLYLIARQIIDWRIPVFYLLTVFIMTFIAGNMNGMSGFWYPTFHLLSGGLLFGAIFMATDLVTSPVARKGKIVFGVCLGILTVFIRLLGNYPEGVFFSILFMNLFKPIIDRSFMGRMSLPMSWREKLGWFMLLLIVIGSGVLVGYGI